MLIHLAGYFSTGIICPIFISPIIKMKKENKQKPNIYQGEINRRNFITKSAIAGIGLGALSFSTASAKRAESEKEISNLSKKRKLGTLEVSAIGLGCMSMTSGSYNPPRSKKEMIPVIRGAFDKGVTFFDTAEVYGPFTDEEIVGEALAPIRDKVVIASKFGFSFDNGQRSGRNSQPKHIKQAVEGMLKRLKTDRIDLLYLHRLDPNVPIEEVAGTVKELIQEGKALHFGLSEVAPDTMRKANQEQKVSALQTQYSLAERFPENQILDTCEELGIGFVPWGPVFRGFLGDKFNEYSRFSEDSRFASVASFTPEGINQNMALLKLVREWAMKKDATPAQISLAWLLHQKPFIVPIPGTTKLHHVDENMKATQVKFTSVELEEFRTAFSKIELAGVRTMESALKDQ